MKLETEKKAIYEDIAKSHAWNFVGDDFVTSSRQLAEKLKMPRSRVLKALHELVADGLVEKRSMGRPAVVSYGEVTELECEAMPPANGWGLTKQGYDTEYYRAEQAACDKSLADWANGAYDERD
jgi:DNA-binding transcriptional MocR family regulator